MYLQIIKNSSATFTRKQQIAKVIAITLDVIGSYVNGKMFG